MYAVELMPKAIKDLKSFLKQEAKKLVEKIQALEGGLTADIKKLTNFSPESRLRVGNYRVLFEVEEQKILVYRFILVKAIN